MRGCMRSSWRCEATENQDPKNQDRTDQSRRRDGRAIPWPSDGGAVAVAVAVAVFLRRVGGAVVDVADDRLAGDFDAGAGLLELLQAGSFANDHQNCVGLVGDVGGLRDCKDRRSVDDDELLTRGERGHGVLERWGAEEACRIGGAGRSGRDEEQIGPRADAPLANQVGGVAFVGGEVGEARDIREVGESGETAGSFVGIDQERALAAPRGGDGEVERR